MFSWITGPRLQNVIEEIEPDPACDTTFIEPPDTPAPQFALKAFKHAFLGTPAQADHNTSNKNIEKKMKHDSANTEFAAPKDSGPASSPSKQNKSILMTPGTTSKGRKTVSFGSQVLDNEGKRGAIGRSGIPSDCPGKFPSPWTPGTELKGDVASDTKPRTKLTAALYDARSTTQPKSGQKAKARDDSDITLDMGAPRSESGKYWKEQYESYAERSEKQMKQLVHKQQVAKNFAKKKDGEAMEATTRLAEERKRHQSRIRQLESQNKDLQERLRIALAEKTAGSIEIAALRNKVETLEKSLVVSSSEVQNSKLSFNIFEDVEKDASTVQAQKSTEALSQPTVDMPSIILGNPVKKSRTFSENKENSPPKPSRIRGQVLSDVTPRPSSSHNQASKIEPPTGERSDFLVRSSRQTTDSAHTGVMPSYTPLSALRTTDTSKHSLPPKSPALLPSSPLPQPSPDPWMQADDSPAAALDRLAFPIASGPSSYSRPAAKPHARHRVSKSLPQTKQSSTNKPEYSASTTHEKNDTSERLQASSRQPFDKPVTMDSQIETSSKSALQHAESYSRIIKDNKEPLPVDRKEQARRRLEERKKRKGI